MNNYGVVFDAEFMLHTKVKLLSVFMEAIN